MIRIPLSRVLISALSALLTVASLPAAEPASIQTTQPTQPAGEQVQTVRLSVQPAAAPKPAMSIYLLPPLLDRLPGNAAGTYGIALQMMPADETDADRDKIEKWLKMASSVLPRDEVRNLLSRYEQSFRYAVLASRYERCDWDLPVRQEGINLLLPNLQGFRRLGRMLALDARLALAEGRLDEAIARVRTSLALSRHVSEGTFLIGALVGIANATVALEQAREVLAADGSPNLYWALVQLPDPLISMRHAMEYEQNWLYFSYPQLRGLGDLKLSDEQWNERARAAMNLLALAGGKDGSTAADALRALAAGMKMYPQGKQWLLSQGRSAKEVEAMPHGQVIVLSMMGQYEQWRDEIFKWFALPYAQARAGMEKTLRAFDDWASGPGRGNLAAVLLPSLGRAAFVHASLEREVAALRCVEAVRLYAAAHGGQPPAELGQINLVPVPADPVTGKPFGYHVEGKGFVLESIEGLRPRDQLRWVVELREAGTK